MKVNGIVSLITGGARGLGRGFAEALLEHGAKHVCLLDLETDAGLTTANDFNQTYGPGTAMFIKCDVTKRQQFENAFKKAKEMFGRLDIVVNNAGIVNEDNWEKMVDVNLISVIRGSYLARDYMDETNGGNGGLIINISSAAGLHAAPPSNVYTASKFGVVGFSKALAGTLAMAPDNKIRVSCLCPTFTETPMVMDNLDGIENMPASIAQIGIMKVSEVVKAFMMLVGDDRAQGGVMLVNPQGIQYKAPRHLVGKL